MEQKRGHGAKTNHGQAFHDDVEQVAMVKKEDISEDGAKKTKIPENLTGHQEHENIFTMAPVFAPFHDLNQLEVDDATDEQPEKLNDFEERNHGTFLGLLPAGIGKTIDLVALL
jgi:hypothetical protein